MNDHETESTRGLLTSAWFYYGICASLSVWAAIAWVLREALQ